MKWDDSNIVFLISMPRSGSTLLQRILLNQPEVASTSESWLLLPQVYTLKENMAFSVYSHTAASRAVNDFTENLLDGTEEYLSIIKSSIIESFQRVSGENKDIYLEKTPRNNLILKEIVKMFPNSKFIFLWRNPAAVAASMIESFSAGKWNIYRQEIDLYEGYENMLGAYSLNIKNRVDIRYEELVNKPDKITNELMLFLEINSKVDVAGFVNSKLKGRMGDPTGVSEYSTISTKSLNKWKNTFCNPLRKYWIMKYVKSLDENDLSRIGYNKNELIQSVSTIKINYKNIFSDILRMIYGVIDRNFQITLIRQLRRACKGRRKYTLQ